MFDLNKLRFINRLRDFYHLLKDNDNRALRKMFLENYKNNPILVQLLPPPSKWKKGWLMAYPTLRFLNEEVKIGPMSFKEYDEKDLRFIEFLDMIMGLTPFPVLKMEKEIKTFSTKTEPLHNSNTKPVELPVIAKEIEESFNSPNTKTSSSKISIASKSSSSSEKNSPDGAPTFPESSCETTFPESSCETTFPESSCEIEIRDEKKLEDSSITIPEEDKSLEGVMTVSTVDKSLEDEIVVPTTDNSPEDETTVSMENKGPEKDEISSEPNCKKQPSTRHVAESKANLGRESSENGPDPVADSPYSSPMTGTRILNRGLSVFTTKTYITIRPGKNEESLSDVDPKSLIQIIGVDKIRLLNYRDIFGKTLLELAFEVRNKFIFQILLIVCPELIETIGSSKKTILDMVVDWNDVKLGNFFWNELIYERKNKSYVKNVLLYEILFNNEENIKMLKNICRIKSFTFKTTRREIEYIEQCFGKRRTFCDNSFNKLITDGFEL